LLRRDVGGGAEPLLIGTFRLGVPAGDAEIGQLHTAGGGQHDIVGLDIAVHNSGPFGGGQRFGNGQRDCRRPFPRRTFSPADQILDGAAVDIFHHHIGQSGCRIDGRVDHPDHIGMVNPAGQPSLGQEFFEIGGVSGHFRLEHLGGIAGAGSGIAHQVDLAHSAASEQAVHHIFSEPVAGCEQSRGAHQFSSGGSVFSTIRQASRAVFRRR